MIDEDFVKQNMRMAGRHLTERIIDQNPIDARSTWCKS